MDLIFALSFMNKVEKDTILGILEPRFGAMGAKDQSHEQEMVGNKKNDDDVEIVDEEDIEENDIVLQGDLREKASKHIDIDSDSSDDSTPCLTCGKIILNKFLKIHSRNQ